jgi:hypothetical protein
MVLVWIKRRKTLKYKIKKRLKGEKGEVRERN